MIARTLSLTEALALEGKVTVPRLVPPTVEQIKAADPGEFVNRHRVRIDPVKAKDTVAMVRFEFTDAKNEAVALHVRRGVVEYVENPEPTCSAFRSRAWPARGTVCAASGWTIRPLPFGKPSWTPRPCS
jgi:hypothetical protein